MVRKTQVAAVYRCQTEGTPVSDKLLDEDGNIIPFEDQVQEKVNELEEEGYEIKDIDFKVNHDNSTRSTEKQAFIFAKKPRIQNIGLSE
jgi:hypothetical protein